MGDAARGRSGGGGVVRGGGREERPPPPPHSRLIRVWADDSKVATPMEERRASLGLHPRVSAGLYRRG